MVADVCTYDKKDVTIHVKNPKKTIKTKTIHANINQNFSTY